MYYITEMNKILTEKKSRGMKGIRFFVEAESGIADFAHDKDEQKNENVIQI